MNNTEALTLGVGMKSGWVLVSEILLSIVSIIILICIVKLLIRAIRKHDDRVGNTDSNPFRKICKWFFILVAIGYICYIWFGNLHFYLHDHIEIAMTFGVPIGIFLSLGIGDWKSTLCTIIVSGIIAVLIAFFAACFIPKSYYDIVIKVAASIVWAISIIKMYNSNGSYIA